MLRVEDEDGCLGLAPKGDVKIYIRNRTVPYLHTGHGLDNSQLGGEAVQAVKPR